MAENTAGIGGGFIMAQREEIEITITPEGKVVARTRGMKGQSCLAAAELLQQLIGPVESKELTSEYYEAQTSVQVGVETRRGDK